jgi:hypothetical protein
MTGSDDSWGVSIVHVPLFFVAVGPCAKQVTWSGTNYGGGSSLS